MIRRPRTGGAGARPGRRCETARPGGLRDRASPPGREGPRAATERAGRAISPGKAKRRLLVAGAPGDRGAELLLQAGGCRPSTARCISLCRCCCCLRSWSRLRAVMTIILSAHHQPGRSPGHDADARATELADRSNPSRSARGTGDRVLLVEDVDHHRHDLVAHVPISIARSRTIIASTRERTSSDFSMSAARSAIRLPCCSRKAWFSSFSRPQRRIQLVDLRFEHAQVGFVHGATSAGKGDREGMVTPTTIGLPVGRVNAGGPLPRCRW